jgi:hypothetical protein
VLLCAPMPPNMPEDGVAVVAVPKDDPKAGGAVVTGAARAPKAGAPPDALKMLAEAAAVVEVGVPKVALPNPEAVVATGNPVAFGVPNPDVRDGKPVGVVVLVETAPAPNLRELAADPAEVVGVKLNPPTGVESVGSAEGTADAIGVEVAPKERPVAVVGVP